MQKFILDHIPKVPGDAVITGQDAKHIYKVLRLKAGDAICLTDGCGTDFDAIITKASPERILAAVSAGKRSVAESSVTITLCTGMLKDKKMDLVIKHVTQLGITRWIPFFCERSVPTPDKKRLDSRIERWASIARESVKQCGRSLVPRITSPLPFERMIEATCRNDLKIAFWEKALPGLETAQSKIPFKSIALLIGPEGGFTEAEIQLAEKNGFTAFSLGPRILRAETAAISACTLAQHLFGDI